MGEVRIDQQSKVESKMQPQNPAAIFKFIVFSLFGVFAFFVPITINGKSSIPLDHVVGAIRQLSPSLVTVYIAIVLGLGAIYPFITKTWRKNTINLILSIFKIAGFVFGLMLIFNIGPNWLFNPDMGPFLLESLIKPVGVLIPVGAVFLSFLVGYGLLEFIGVFMQPIMRPLFRTPGRSAIDAVASFVGSYSIGLLVTNRVFKQGKYTIREAAIIATGFSTVSVTFMVVIANTLNLMEYWNLYFWTSLIVTFIVTAITVRIWPLHKMEDSYITEEGDPEAIIKEKRFQHAWKEAMESVNNTPSFTRNILVHLKEGFIMTMNTLPSIMSVGLLGLVLATYTPIFDWMGYLFLPFTWLLQAPEPMLTAKAAAISISEIFLPSLLVVDADLVTRFVVAVVSVSSILFFSAVIPVILSTDIPLSVRNMVIIWFERVVLTLAIIIPIALLIF